MSSVQSARSADLRTVPTILGVGDGLIAAP
jgi:hypothetical protein